jgi:hypothetical protein
MKSYPRLYEMGVRHPLQISGYSVSSIDYIDVLRIAYDRPKGSKLPGARTYRFPRVQKTLPSGTTTDGAAAVMESDPALRTVIEELQQVTKLKDENQDIAQLIREELRLLEEDIALRSEYLKTLVDKINKV